MVVFGIAVAMFALMLGWNAAAHRKDDRTELVMSILFYVLTAVLFVCIIRIVFFR